MEPSGDANTVGSAAHRFLLLFFLIEQIVCYEFIYICFLQIIRRFSDGGKYLPAKLNIRKQKRLNSYTAVPFRIGIVASFEQRDYIV